MESDAVPHPPPRQRAMLLAAMFGIATGLLSTMPSPLPDLRFSDPEIIINADGIPLHAGLVFGTMLAGLLWFWSERDPGKCLLAGALTLIGWLTAVNTANDVMSGIVASDLFGTTQGAKGIREVLGWLVAGMAGGLIGAGFAACGVSIAAPSARSASAWALILGSGALLGLLLYPAAKFDAGVLLFVPWQAAVAASIAYGLTRA